MSILDQFQKLEDLIVEHTVPPVQTRLRNQLALSREQAEAYQRDSDRQDQTLQRQAQTIAALQEENARLLAGLKAKEADPFIEHRGALYKRDGTRGIQEALYCVSCRGLMGYKHPSEFVSCPQCHTCVQFTGYHIPEVLDEVRASLA